MRVRIEFEVEVPDVGATEEQIIEWLRFECHDNGSMEMSNPLLDKDPTPSLGSFEVRHPNGRPFMY